MNAVFQAAFLPCNCCILSVFISSDGALQREAVQSISLVSERSLKPIKLQNCSKCTQGMLPFT